MLDVLYSGEKAKKKKTTATSFPKAQLYDKSQEGEEQI